MWVALLTFGEGWHNNHHAHAQSARHGLRWWEIDLNWYGIKLLQVLGLARDVKTVNVHGIPQSSGRTAPAVPSGLDPVAIPVAQRDSRS
jgi:stearoyl-CoA desaturase (delta-9 desaturase)